MTLNVEVTKSGTDNTANVIRKFSRKMQGTGIVRALRSRRYWERSFSKTVKKKHALRRLARRETYQKLLKEGKVSERPQRRGGRR